MNKLFEALLAYKTLSRSLGLVVLKSLNLILMVHFLFSVSFKKINVVFDCMLGLHSEILFKLKNQCICLSTLIV